ncbi:thioredoxin family protein [Bremerella cremea]|uniref:TlpA family protein disulfide reductase n=1 Tax=Bremerella cremea TaxID=1031537 RepID=UPI0031F15564
MHGIFAIAVLAALLLTSTAQADVPRARAAVAIAYAAITGQASEIDGIPDPPPGPRPEPDSGKAAPGSGFVAYDDAYHALQDEGKPLVVMVTARWCPACPATKERLLATHQAGELGDVSLSLIDYDLDANMRGKVLKGLPQKLPAIVLYRQRAQGHQQEHFTNTTGRSAVDRLKDALKRPVAMETSKTAVGTYCRFCK